MEQPAQQLGAWLAQRFGSVGASVDLNASHDEPCPAPRASPFAYVSMLHPAYLDFMQATGRAAVPAAAQKHGLSLSMPGGTATAGAATPAQAAGVPLIDPNPSAAAPTPQIAASISDYGASQPVGTPEVATMPTEHATTHTPLTPGEIQKQRRLAAAQAQRKYKAKQKEWVGHKRCNAGQQTCPYATTRDTPCPLRM